MKKRAGRDDGFSLMEVLVALSLVAFALTVLAQLFLLCARANVDARRASMATLLANQKMEQLLLPSNVIDAETSDTLAQNTADRCDFLDMFGRPVGGGTFAPPGTAYVRRWSVAQERAGSDALLIQVLVQPHPARVATDAASSLRSYPGSAHLVAVKIPEVG